MREYAQAAGNAAQHGGSFHSGDIHQAFAPVRDLAESQADNPLQPLMREILERAESGVLQALAARGSLTVPLPGASSPEDQ